VDDDSAIRDLASGLLLDGGYKVMTARNGIEALRLIGGTLPDLVITDLRMPRMSGFELLKVLRERFPQLPVIAISGEFTGDALPPGVIADVFLSKDCYATPRLVATIEELLAIAPMRTGARTNSNLSPDVNYWNADSRAVLGRLAQEASRPAADSVGTPYAADDPPQGSVARLRRPSAFATSAE
jgi:CheY-like chemotaxis protein